MDTTWTQQGHGGLTRKQNGEWDTMLDTHKLEVQHATTYQRFTVAHFGTSES